MFGNIVDFDGLITMDLPDDNNLTPDKIKKYAEEEFLKYFPEYTLTSYNIANHDIDTQKFKLKGKCLVCGYKKNK